MEANGNVEGAVAPPVAVKQEEDSDGEDDNQFEIDEKPESPEEKPSSNTETPAVNLLSEPAKETAIESSGPVKEDIGQGKSVGAPASNGTHVGGEKQSHDHLQTAEELPDDMELTIEEERSVEKKLSIPERTEAVPPPPSKTTVSKPAPVVYSAPHKFPPPPPVVASKPEATYMPQRPPAFVAHKPPSHVPALAHYLEQRGTIPTAGTTTSLCEYGPNESIAASFGFTEPHAARNESPRKKSRKSKTEEHGSGSGKRKSVFDDDDDENPKLVPYKVRPKSLSAFSGCKRAFWAQSKVPQPEDIPNHFMKPEDVFSLPSQRPNLQVRCSSNDTKHTIDAYRLQMMVDLTTDFEQMERREKHAMNKCFKEVNTVADSEISQDEEVKKIVVDSLKDLDKSIDLSNKYVMCMKSMRAKMEQILAHREHVKKIVENNKVSVSIDS
eukprot:Nk52_evm39s270 gene=Nk52_evmTU39s270